MAYLRHLLYHEDLLSKIEKTLHSFSEDHPFSLPEIPYASQENISKIVSIKNKAKTEKLLKRLDFLQFFESIIFRTLQICTTSLQKQKHPLSTLF